MIFLPGSCERCRYIALISNHDCVSAQALCGACGGVVNILPGPAYPEGDVPLFEALLALVEASGIAGVEAAQAAMAIEDARSSFDEQSALRAISERLPALEPLGPLLAASPSRARQALSMLEVILRALSNERRSGAGLRGLRRTVGRAMDEGAREWQVDEPPPQAWGDARKSR
jgi:hypothetical protein